MPIMHHLAVDGHCEVLLRDVQVGHDALLGEDGAGFALAQARLGPGRIHHCMRTIGQCELALDLMGERALERRAFGKRLADQSNHARLDRRVAGGDRPGPAAGPARGRPAWTAKAIAPHGWMCRPSNWWPGGLQTRVVDRAMQVFGGMGLTCDTPLSLLWTMGRALRLADGPDEVHLGVVAKAELARIQQRHRQQRAVLHAACGNLMFDALTSCIKPLP
jgi:acyl-CoA dehydrogenase